MKILKSSFGFLCFIALFALVAGCKSTPKESGDQSLKKELEAKEANARALAEQKNTELDKQIEQARADELKQIEDQLTQAQADENPETTVSAADEKEKELLNDLIKQQMLEKDTRMKLADKKYEIAVQMYKDNNLADARKILQEALNLNPAHIGAKDMMKSIDLTLHDTGGDVSTIMRELENDLKVSIELSRANILDHYKRGLKAMEEKKYENAIIEFETALDEFTKTTWDLGLADVRSRAEEEIENAKFLRVELKKEEDRRLRESAEKAARQTEEREKALKNERALLLLKRATELFEQKRYEKVEELADQIGDLSADEKIRGLTADIKTDAIRARQKQAYAQFIEKKIDAWKTAIELIKEDMIPPNPKKPVVYPDDATWQEVEERAAAVGIFKVEDVADPMVLDVQNRLQTLKISMDFEEANLEQIVDYIVNFFTTTDPVSNAKKKQITILIESSVPATDPMRFTITNATLKEVLDLLSDFFDCAYVIKSGIVMFTTKEASAGDMIADIYNIKDLITPVTMFKGPDVRLISDDSASFDDVDEEVEELTPEMLEESLKSMIEGNVVSPQGWNENGTNLSIIPSIGLLYIVNTKEVHQELKKFLSKLRSFTSAMVAIEARFLNTYDDFLQDIDNEFRNLQQYTMPDLFPTGNLDDPAFELPGGGNEPPYGAGVFANESAGNSESYDLRFRTAFTFLSAAGASNTNTQLGQNLTNQGGLGMQYQVYNEGEPLMMIVTRMLQKDERLTLLSAPRLTAFNTQRSNVMILQQRSYIKDYNVELASGIRAYDPVIGTLQEGMVLDIRPIISYDKRYVTVELRISWLQLQLLRNVQFLTAGTTPIQLPWVRNYRTQTTIRIPDKGSLIISGMKQATDRDLSAETPLLGKIPLLSFFFSRKAKSTELRNVVLLLRPEILDVAELEKTR